MAKVSKKAAAAKEAEQATKATTEAASADQPTQLTIADLQLLARIIDLASRRGAFQAGELSQVGESYNKLVGFLSYVDGVKTKSVEAEPPVQNELAVEETAQQVEAEQQVAVEETDV